MARGGFISSELCVSKMADLVGSRAKAQRILADALLNGSLSARGRPPREILPCPPGQLRDLGSGLGDDVGPPKPVENVPAGFWKSVNGNDIVKWNWRNGWFVCLGYPGKNELYDDVRFNEAELNALLDKRRESIGGEGPRARKKRGEVRALFTAGVGFLARQGTLTETVHSCIGERDWPKLARRLVATAQNIVDRPLLVDRARLSKDVGTAETTSDIERMINAGKAPCVFFRGKSRHYTVISGYTPSSLKLFDSFGYHRVLRRSCGTARTPGSLHRFHLQSIITLAAP